jgi:hypothetical protein
MEDAAVARQQERADKAEDNAARTKREIDVAAARVKNTGLSPTDRAYAATLQFSRTPTLIDPTTGQRTFPDQQEVDDFAQQAKVAGDAVYGTSTSGRRTFTQTQRADRFEELRKRGMSLEAAREQVIREMPE